ncbi:hypothetical protein [Methanogenium cariaci]|uniref:hypothetical protein n=1 Tax=Methanogenium cariaci TaxID=2197 RepID=UPI0012F630D7|nr:hypothetical protein [Methanogenium cariaci]
MDEFAIISRDSTSVESDFYRAIDFYNTNKEQILEDKKKFISYADGTAGEKNCRRFAPFY